jgi:hypothetical protein
MCRTLGELSSYEVAHIQTASSPARGRVHQRGNEFHINVYISIIEQSPAYLPSMLRVDERRAQILCHVIGIITTKDLLSSRSVNNTMDIQIP